ncbi:TetR/AcrR family transcriptional regulator [Mycobacterium bourgelatii]|uniref:TetR family transcriptional regulator n=1 Tax=Mycobacterium bourgelatii TaxID=1273442 RepID=A0A7I9YZP6_MYCBU|nr:TetR/AcrR family transcriptional regulator [Mycobacterium bourgelatii]MCV6976558.1 TetR/AcrR family transcriptional regulator [Mycobacterium bourgelatii]GFG94007.1 TetR family transcriptional regulator [Mycobacterium bourgelatii]
MASATALPSGPSGAAGAELVDADPFRQRLLGGLATSIDERGYRATTVADIVRHARTSKRTFYDQFSSKEQCFLELLLFDNQKLASNLRAAVDPEADWHVQIRQVVEAFVDHIESRPSLTLSWIRELPSLGDIARPVQRHGTQLLTGLLIELSASPGFKRANLPPLSVPLAVILLGGVRELTAIAVEDGRPVRDVVEPTVDASIALLGPRHQRD